MGNLANEERNIEFILDFETRWLGIFEEIKNEALDPNSISIMEMKLRLEIDEILTNFHISEKNTEHTRTWNRFALALARVDSQYVKMYVLTTSRWKSKNKWVFAFPNFGKNLSLLSMLPKQ